jgi:hypothetical protein
MSEGKKNHLLIIVDRNRQARGWIAPKRELEGTDCVIISDHSI